MPDALEPAQHTARSPRQVSAELARPVLLPTLHLASRYFVSLSKLRHPKALHGPHPQWVASLSTQHGRVQGCDVPCEQGNPLPMLEGLETLRQQGHRSAQGPEVFSSHRAVPGAPWQQPPIPLIPSARPAASQIPAQSQLPAPVPTSGQLQVAVRQWPWLPRWPCWLSPTLQPCVKAHLRVIFEPGGLSRAELVAVTVVTQHWHRPMCT